MQYGPGPLSIVPDISKFRDSGTFFQVGEGEGGLNGDLKWGGDRAEETLLLISLYFLRTN